MLYVFIADFLILISVLNFLLIYILDCYILCPDTLKYNYPFVWYYKTLGTLFDPPDRQLWRIKFIQGE